MTDRTQQAAQLMTVMEQVLGLTIDDAWRPQVLGFLVMAANAADLYVDLPLDEAHDQAAPIFRPGSAP